MTKHVNGDTLHRLMKQVLDDGTVKDVEEALRLFEGYRLSVLIDSKQVDNPIDQMVLLTILALASRVFLGGVNVCGDLDTSIASGLPFAGRLSDEVVRLGGTIVAEVGDDPLIVVGGGERPRSQVFSVRTVVSGWRAGICPSHSKVKLADKRPIPLVATLSAALAVNEAYLHVNGDMPSAGHRTVGISLWNPDASVDWRAADSSEPDLRYLPTKLWLIGLGHLGQAYLWNLGLLPYADPSELSLVLQDVDVVTESTPSTSILTDISMVGLKKTRAMANWAEARGFSVSLQERYFASDFKRQSVEPGIALCGLDNALGRRALDSAGFDMVVEAGLGRGHEDFRKLRTHVLPGHSVAEKIWPLQQDTNGSSLADIYKNMVKEGKLDQCGATLLAGKAVGAPFVGMVASCFVISEVLRLLHGGVRCLLVDLDLVSIDYRQVVFPNADECQLQFNPGFTEAGW